jgi:predicted short-subunit dehydrogenase-like oxidoreductase (DUF2520 family)
MKQNRFRISIVGAGNMAFRLGIALRDAGHDICAVWSRRRDAGEKLTSILSSEGGSTRYTEDLADLIDSQIIILAVSDNAINELATRLAAIMRIGQHTALPLTIHTSGATDISALAPLAEIGTPCGVLWPMMTLSKNKNIQFNEAPLLIECPDQRTRETLEAVAYSLRCEYFHCDSARRLQMHCAAVFASNFTNYALSLAYELAGDKAPYLIPTAIEAVRKCCIFHPDQVQTGPALRGDTATMERHIHLLHEMGLTEHEEIYKIISKNIPHRIKKR